jgi:glyoxylase-like metal-dependent hydrolase (beta-lactamase superfamily II)
MKITENVYALNATQGNYAYAVRTPEGAILVDTGRPGQGKKSLAELASLGIQPADVRHIFLTHHDIDHIGSAAFLQRETGAQVWASQTDIPYILGEKTRHGIKKYISVLMRAELPTGIRAYPPDGRLEGFEVIPTPGHTPGHVCLLYQDVLFAGDLVMGRGGQLKLSPGIMTWDPAQVKESAKKIAGYSFQWICLAHGEPMPRGDQWEKLYG